MQIHALNYHARLEAVQQAEAQHEATDRAADLSIRVHELEQRNGELEDEIHELRQQLKGAGE